MAALLVTASSAEDSSCDGAQDEECSSLMQVPLTVAGHSLSTVDSGADGAQDLSEPELSPGMPVKDHWGCHQVKKQDASELPFSSRVAVLIPFREQNQAEGSRRKELDSLLANLTQNARKAADAGSQWHFFITEQSEKGPFNRGALMNVGFESAKAFFGENVSFTAVTQDCDFIPGDDMVRFYSRSGDGPLHLANYAYCPGFGGVTIFRSDQYTSMNGYTNKMWGWGGEDDDAMDRWMSHPSHIVVAPLGHERFKDIGREMDGRRDRSHYDKSMAVWNRDVHQQAWVHHGLTDLKYEMLSKVEEEDALVDHVVVELENGGLR